jgi:DHA1 family inner membrane transport protein
VILFILMVCAFAVATAEFVLVGLLPEISADLAVSVPEAGFLVTVYMLVVTIGGPAAVVATRRLPRRTVLAAAMAIALGSAVVSALAGTYGVLLVGRLGSALGQALFVAVASDVAASVVPPERQTAAVARVFNGFALATVIGLPLGTVIGQAYGWHAAFAAVAVLCAVGLVGIVVACPPVPAREGAGTDLRGVLRPRIVLGLATTVLAFTGFVAAFTYVAPMLRDVTGLSAGWVSAALVLYGIGTVAGTTLAGRVRPAMIARVLPVPLTVLAGVLVVQSVVLGHAGAALVGVVLLGASAFVVAPLLQTWLMREAGDGAAGLVAAVNISVFGLAGALGAALGGFVLDRGGSLGSVNLVAAVPVVAAVVLAVVIGRRSVPSYAATRD